MSDKIREIIESRTAPGILVRHPAGEQRYISTLARYPGDKEAYVTSISEAKRKAKAQGKEIKNVEDVSPVEKKESPTFAETFNRNWEKK